ncbi:MAG: glycosyltransferase family 2 protein [Candidatus Zixiibacteriota bacterium]|nr:MAG: glycosyltransferase family 2 protein [candidate division Zixibacteria bacterium]
MYISVIIISFNGIEFIKDCLATVFTSLAGIDAEIIVIDNGSADGTCELIKARYPEVKLTKNPGNLGYARAVNQGAEQATGKFILLLNQDTRIRDRAIVKMAERMARDSTIGTIGPMFVGFDGTLRKSCRVFPCYRHLFFEFTGLAWLFPRSRLFGEWKMGWFDHLTEHEIDQPMGAALMIRKEIFDAMGRFDETFRIFFNDVDFCRRITERGLRNLYFPAAVVEHYFGGSIGTMKPRMVIESHRAMFRYFRKYSRGIHRLPLLYFWGLVLWLTAYVRAGYHLILRK